MTPKIARLRSICSRLGRASQVSGRLKYVPGQSGDFIRAKRIHACMDTQISRNLVHARLPIQMPSIILGPPQNLKELKPWAPEATWRLIGDKRSPQGTKPCLATLAHLLTGPDRAVETGNWQLWTGSARVSTNIVVAARHCTFPSGSAAATSRVLSASFH